MPKTKCLTSIIFQRNSNNFLNFFFLISAKMNISYFFETNMACQGTSVLVFLDLSKLGIACYIVLSQSPRSTFFLVVICLKMDV